MPGRGRDLGFGLGQHGRDPLGETPRRGRARLPHFTPRGATPRERVAAFVAEARTNPCWLGHVDFDAIVWDVTGAVADRPGRPLEPHAQRLWLCRPRSPGEARRALPACVRGFAAEIVRQTRGVRLGVLKARVEACRYLGEALEGERCDSVAGCNAAVLDAAVALAAALLGERSTAGVATQLGLIAAFLSRHGMTEIPVGDWDPGARVAALPEGAAGREERAADRLPAARYLADLGEAFRRAESVVDVVVSGALALQCASLGCRITEALNLEENCDEGLDNGEALALRWLASKGRGPEVTDVPVLLADFARWALRRVRDATAAARATKRAYDTDADRLYLPPEYEHLRSKPWLTMAEAAVLVGITDPPGLFGYLRREGVRLRPARGPRGGRSFEACFADLERHFLAELPRQMRAAGGPRYHPLFLVQMGTFARGVAGRGSPCMFETVDYHHIRQHLRPPGKAPGLFGRAGIDRAGAADRTHATRHFFTTLARERGVAEDDIAQVAKRTNIYHNAHYEHVPDAAGRALLATVSRSLARGEDPAGPSGTTLPSGGPGVLDDCADALMRAQGLRPSPAPGPTGAADRAA